jgi:hypothetical protein
MYTPAAVFGSTGAGRPFVQDGQASSDAVMQVAARVFVAVVADAAVAVPSRDPAPASAPTMPIAAIRVHLIVALQMDRPVGVTGTR